LVERHAGSALLLTGVLSWDVFIRQFERRFYPVTFLEKMKIDL
jgi:hypothetical protein